MSSSDEVETAEVDCDTCKTDDLSQLFDESLRIVSEEAISLEKDYILYLDSSRGFERIAAATSSRMVHLYDLNSSKGFTQLQKCDGSPFTSRDQLPICGIRFANENPNTIFVAEGSGNIYMYDIRSNPTHVQTFQNDGDNIIKKQFTCFDVNFNDSILCAGTERSKEEAHMLLFDVRKWKMLATYTDSHSEDVSQVKFHPNKPNVMASGSLDGLINVFDISVTDENDALEYCLNTESSVQAIEWHSRSDMEVNDSASKDFLSCITDTNDFHLYDVEDSELVFQAKREQIAEQIKRKSESECYLVNCHNAANGDIILLAGSNSNAGECLRSLTVHDKSLKQRNNFTENKQIVRCSLFNAKDNVLITAGEGGIVTVWENFQSSKSGSHQLKEKVKTKGSRKSKPY